MADTTKKVMADMPEALVDELDALGTQADLTRSQIVREAIDRFMPILRQRAAERELLASIVAPAPETAEASL